MTSTVHFGKQLMMTKLSSKLILVLLKKLSSLILPQQIVEIVMKKITLPKLN